ncbi:MAG: cbb3-type cytochrome c oxidase subunit 3 [Bacteroidetes bacterium]|nr:cbb3-type cytochrome c oxidase subunit 3 [Bacteroidota bacterium]
MSRIIARILEDVTWLDELSSVMTIFFILLFVFVVYGVLKMKKSEAEDYKRIPLTDDDSDNYSNK